MLIDQRKISFPTAITHIFSKSRYRLLIGIQRCPVFMKSEMKINLVFLFIKVFLKIFYKFEL